jgi:hypothetical protein
LKEGSYSKEMIGFYLMSGNKTPEESAKLGTESALSI